MISLLPSFSSDEDTDVKRSKRDLPPKDYKEKEEDDLPDSPQFNFDSDDEETLRVVGESTDKY